MRSRINDRVGLPTAVRAAGWRRASSSLRAGLTGQADVDFPVDVCPFLGLAQRPHEVIERRCVGRGILKPGKSKGSTRSRQWCRRRVTADRYFSPTVMCLDLSSKTARRSSCARAHQAAVLRIGISAARSACARPSFGCRATSSRCSALVTYCSLLTTPRRHQATSPLRGAPDSTTMSRSAAGSVSPTTSEMLSMPQGPVAPPTKLTCTGTFIC